MADISDVEQAIVSLISDVVYPSGTSQPSIVRDKDGSTVGVRVYRGWPQPASLDSDLAAKIVNISVFPRGSVERNTTRYLTDYQEISRQTATFTAVVADSAVIIGGVYDAAISQFVTVLVGPRIAVSVAVAANDTPATVAASLAALLSAQGVGATVAGSVVTVHSSAFLVATVGVNGEQMLETRRQQTQVLITLWCANPAIRDNAGRVIEPFLADATFLTLADGSAARFRYHGTVSSDTGQKIQTYRRDLIYDVEYATTKTDSATEVTAVTIGSKNGPIPIGVTPENPSTQTVLPTA